MIQLFFWENKEWYLEALFRGRMASFLHIF